MKRNHFVTIGLMSTSIMLLLVLQFFWLRGAYNEAAENFRKESSQIFRTTIFALQDSLLQKSLRPLKDADSVLQVASRHGQTQFRLRDSLIIKTTDSVFNGFSEKRTNIEIITNGDEGDLAIRHLLRPLTAKLKTTGKPKTFIFRMDADTLNVDSIRLYFSRMLKEADLDSDFKIIQIKGRGPRRNLGSKLDIQDASFRSDFIPLNPLTGYAAEFDGVPSLLMKKITPQILFSLFLTIVTTITFFVMFRNMRSQQRLMEIKNDFISNVTHELKTPVATVSVALEALKNFNALNDPQKTKEYLEIAQAEVNRLTLMTDKVLKTTVYEDRGITFKFETLDLGQLAEEVLSSMKLVFEKRQTVLTFDRTGGDFTLEGSHEHLTHVLYNLIDNGLKYGGEKSSLRISLVGDADFITLSVKDSGIGIPKEYQKKIFEKFFRVPSGDVHNNKGYGLGLSYVATVIDNHKGTIAVKSEPGMGSEFIITLPRKRI